MKTVLITLDRVTLKEPLNQSGETLALTTLTLPRPGIQQRTVLKPFHLQKGKASLARRAFHEKALLKEKVEGPFSLTVQLTPPTNQSELQTLLRSIVGIGLETAGDLLASGLRISALRPLLREPFDALADELADVTPEFILEGSLDLNSEILSEGKVTIPLQLNASIRKSDLSPGPKSRDKRKTSAKTYKKGLTLGEAVLKIEIL